MEYPIEELSGLHPDAYLAELEGCSGTGVIESLGDQGMQIDAEEHERPEHDRSQTFENVARDVPGHEILMGTCDH
jgi:hypothetical protein